ncbi:uncharacterized protein LOC144923217 [Branchiostoma floridae x Branchiostoma belcheri]
MDTKLGFVLCILQIWATIFTSARPAPRSVNDVTFPSTPRHVTGNHLPINGVQTAGVPGKGTSTPLATTPPNHKSTYKTVPTIPTTSVSGFSNSVGRSTKLYTTLERFTLPISNVTDKVTAMTPRITSPKGNCSNATECRQDQNKGPSNYSTVLAVTAITSIIMGIVLGTGAWHLRQKLLLSRARKRMEERRSQIVYNSNPAYHQSCLASNDKLYSTILNLNDYSPHPVSKLSNGNGEKDDGKKVTTTSFTSPPCDVTTKGDKRTNAKERFGNPLNVLKLY